MAATWSQILVAETVSALAGTALSANDVVYLHKVSSDLTADKADATDSTKPAMGFVISAVTNPGDTATVYLDGELPGTSLTPGAIYYLDKGANAGKVTATAPSATGNIIQAIGPAISETQIKFDPDRCPIVLV